MRARGPAISTSSPRMPRPTTSTVSPGTGGRSGGAPRSASWATIACSASALNARSGARSGRRRSSARISVPRRWRSSRKRRDSPRSSAQRRRWRARRSAASASVSPRAAARPARSASAASRRSSYSRRLASSRATARPTSWLSPTSARSATSSARAGTPCRRAIGSARLCPTVWYARRKRGAPVAGSTSKAATSSSGLPSAKVFTCGKWDVKTSRGPRSSRSVSTPTASAAPSTGSVPAPGSSRSTSPPRRARRAMSARFSAWAEKVERSRSMDCSSPRSTNTASKNGKRLSIAAGTKRPAWAIRTQSPRVLRATVLPPVLGPVIARPRWSARTRRSTGTTGRPLVRRRGWRAAASAMSSAPRTGRVQPCASAKAAAAPSASTTASPSSSAASAAACSRTSAVTSARTRRSSASSSLAASSRRLFRSTAKSGSMNAVSPELERSWTTPATVPAAAIRIGTTKRPLRTVT